MYTCWTCNAAAAAAAADMLSIFCKPDRLSAKALTSDDTHGDDRKPRASGLSTPLPFSPDRTPPSPELPLSHPSVLAFSPAGSDNDDDAAAAVPCLAFGSEDGYQAFSLGEGRMRGDVAMLLARGRRHVPSPYGGKVFVTDMFGRYPCRLVDPFTGEVTPLPDLPIPLSEESPMPVLRDEPEPARFRLSTEDGFAWDWSPHGVMVARGDTAFFCETGGGEWTPVHRSRHGSPMTVNYRAGFFFVLDMGTLRTAVIHSETPDRLTTEIDPPPRVGDFTWALLVASVDDVLLLVRGRSRNRYNVDAHRTFFQAYRARHREDDRPIRWETVTDIGDRAVFVDHAHGFTVRAGSRTGAMRNCVYRAIADELPEEERSRRDDAALVVVVSPLSDLGKRKEVEGSEVHAKKLQASAADMGRRVLDHACVTVD